MRAAIISLGSKSSKMTAKAMKKYFSVVDLINIKEIEISVGTDASGILYKGEPLSEYDCVFIKGSFKYSAIQRSIATRLLKQSYIPYKNYSFSIVHDKLLTHLELEKNNIPMPKTYILSSISAADSLLKKITYPIILKIPQGTQGKGVMFADSFAAATSILDTLETLKQPVIIQEFIETGGTDIRAFVVGETVVACMERKSEGEDKRSNLHSGGSAKAIEIDPKVRKVALDTAKALGSQICGVDILMDHKGPKVIEANLSPGLQGITESTGINVAEKIAQFLAIQTEEFLEAKKKGNNVNSLLNEEGIRQVIPDSKDEKSSISKKLDEKEVENKTEVTNFITTLDFRGERILLPEIVSKVSQFKDDEEYFVEYKKGKIIIQKL